MNILITGDSITDCYRGKDGVYGGEFGVGYANIVACKLMAQHPQKFNFFNKGISGNRVVDLYARIKNDCWNLVPDFISILLGINDIWHEFGGKNGVDIERFERFYEMYIADTIKVLPNVKFMILEPFVLSGLATSANYTEFRKQTLQYAKVVCGIAKKYNIKFIALQNIFDEACSKASANYWLADGVHPTAAGHQLIADQWLTAFSEISK